MPSLISGNAWVCSASMGMAHMGGVDVETAR